MRLHRFILKKDLDLKFIEIEEKEVLNQILNVFRLKNGDSFIICDGKGQEAVYKITEINKGKIKAEQKEKITENEKGKRIHLFLSILKKENFELAIQKATECGVYSITPIITKRTIKNTLNINRLEKITKEASEQSGRFFLPKIKKIEKYEDSIKKAIGQKIIFDKSGENLNKFKNYKKEDVSIFIGPEGGFEEKEIKIAEENNFQKISLGKLTLRAETASIIATYLVNN